MINLIINPDAFAKSFGAFKSKKLFNPRWEQNISYWNKIENILI